MLYFAQDTPVLFIPLQAAYYRYCLLEGWQQRESMGRTRSRTRSTCLWVVAVESNTSAWKAHYVRQDEMLLPSAPPRYASRLAAQVALCFLCGDLLLHLGFFADSPESLFTLCGIYMVLYILHCRRRAEALWFFRLQKPADTMARGRLILITTPVLTLMAMAMSLILAASRWLIWKTYFGREYLYNYIAVAYGAYVLGFLEAWFYSCVGSLDAFRVQADGASRFRNLEVTLSIRQRFQERESPLCKPWLQNLVHIIGLPNRKEMLT
jgi:hypothetical protein